MSQAQDPFECFSELWVEDGVDDGVDAGVDVACRQQTIHYSCTKHLYWTAVFVQVLHCTSVLRRWQCLRTANPLLSPLAVPYWNLEFPNVTGSTLIVTGSTKKGLPVTFENSRFQKGTGNGDYKGLVVPRHCYLVSGVWKLLSRWQIWTF